MAKWICLGNECAVGEECLAMADKSLEEFTSLGVVLADPKGELPKNPIKTVSYCTNEYLVGQKSGYDQCLKSLAGYRQTYELEGK